MLISDCEIVIVITFRYPFDIECQPRTCGENTLGLSQKMSDAFSGVGLKKYDRPAKLKRGKKNGKKNQTLFEVLAIIQLIAKEAK